LEATKAGSVPTSVRPWSRHSRRGVAWLALELITPRTGVLIATLDERSVIGGGAGG